MTAKLDPRTPKRSHHHRGRRQWALPEWAKYVVWIGLAPLWLVMIGVLWVVLSLEERTFGRPLNRWERWLGL
jgi:hypothetical protein